MPQENQDTIFSNPILSSLSERELKFLQKYIVEQTYQAGDIILKQGDKKSSFYIIHSGECTIDVRLPGDVYKKIATLSTGGFFGEVSLLSEVPITANVSATKVTSLYVFKKATLKVLRVLDPPFAYKIERAIVTLSVKRIDSIINAMIETLDKISGITSIYEKGSFFPNPKAKRSSLSREDIDVNILKKYCLFVDMESTQLELLWSYMSIYCYEKGFELPLSNAKNPYLGVIYSGAIQDAIIGSKKYNRKIEILEPGKLFAYRTLLSKIEQAQHLIARENTVTIQFDGHVLNNLEKKNKDIWYKLYSQIATNLVTYLYALDRQLIRIESEFGDILKE